MTRDGPLEILLVADTIEDEGAYVIVLKPLIMSVKARGEVVW